MAGHVSVVVQLSNSQTEFTEGGGLQALAWLSGEGWSDHPAGSACLAVAGADPNISGVWHYLSPSTKSL
jgi:hypothetical protein